MSTQSLQFGKDLQFQQLSRHNAGSCLCPLSTTTGMVHGQWVAQAGLTRDGPQSPVSCTAVPVPWFSGSPCMYPLVWMMRTIVPSPWDSKPHQLRRGSDKHMRRSEEGICADLLHHGNSHALRSKVLMYSFNTCLLSLCSVPGTGQGAKGTIKNQHQSSLPCIVTTQREEGDRQRPSRCSTSVLSGISKSDKESMIENQ